MISQSDFEDICATVNVDLQQTPSTGKTQVPTTTKTGLKLFLIPKSASLDIAVISGISFTGYLFTNQLTGTILKLNDKLTSGVIYYEVVGVSLMNQNLDYEPYYKLDLEKRTPAS